MPRGKYGDRYSKEQLEEAVKAVKEGRINQKKAAKLFNIPVMTLSDHVNDRVKEGVKAGGQPVMSTEMEAAFAKKLMDLADLGFGLTRNVVMVKAMEFCIEAKIKHPFGEIKAGRSWYSGFMKRNPCLSLRKPAKLSTMRGKAMDRDKIAAYFKDLHNILKGVGPDQVWNMDESGFNMEHTPVKIICRKGDHNVNARVSASRQNVTVIACANAVGKVMPPMFIVKGKTPRALNGFRMLPQDLFGPSKRKHGWRTRWGQNG